jgi:hypothetical protein
MTFQPPFLTFLGSHLLKCVSSKNLSFQQGTKLVNLSIKLLDLKKVKIFLFPPVNLSPLFPTLFLKATSKKIFFCGM